MHVHHAAGLTGLSLPYQWGQSGAASNAATAAAANAGANQAVPDQVSLSDAAKALQASDGGAGSVSTAGSGSAQTLSPDFTQEQQLLTTLTDKSLEAMGIISPADESGTQISFDSLSYSASSSVFASISQQTQASSGVPTTSNDGQTSAQLSSEQDVTLVGEGQITTADGRQFDFQVELQLDQSQQIDASATTPGADAGNAVPSAGAANATDAGALNPSSQLNLPDSLSQLLALLSPSTSTATNAAAVPNANSGVSGSGTVQDAQGGNQAAPASTPTTTTSAGSLNWDAILKQTKAVFDLLDSVAASNQPQTAPAT